MIAVCQNVAMSAEDKLLMRHQLRKHKILTKVFPNQILKPFLEDSKYQNLLPLFVGHNLLLVSEEPKVKEMVRILKSVPFLPLLGEQPVGGGAEVEGVLQQPGVTLKAHVGKTVAMLGGYPFLTMGPACVTLGRGSSDTLSLVRGCFVVGLVTKLCLTIS